MKTLFLRSLSPSSRFNDLAALLIRLGFGILMIPHGYAKLTHFTEYQGTFIKLLGLDSTIALGLVIFAELFCSLLLIVGLATRLALIPLLITAMVIVFIVHQGDIFGDGSTGFYFLLAYITILLLGPGKYSADYQLSQQLITH